MAENYNANEIVEIVNRYLEAYRRRDIDELGNLVARDANFTAYGTDEGESWHGWENFKKSTEKLFKAVKELHWDRGKTRVTFSRDGTCAWFSEEHTGHFLTADGKKHTRNFRLTGVSEKRGGQWVLVQFHRSAPIKGFAVPYLETHGVRFD